jgi:hypothetical protein
MKAEIVNVTPAKALEWLKFNTDNRPLRRTVVNGLKMALQRGEYVQTHQGIAFGVDGALLDGQHRLTAISELRDGVFPMLVAWGVPNDAFKVMDIGIKRSAADSLKEDRRLVEVARLIAVICDTKRTTVTPTQLLPIIDRIQHTHESLVAFAPRSIRTWSAASVRTAAVVSVLTRVDFDYVKTIYRSLVMCDYAAMPSVGHALVKAVNNGGARASDVLDMVARCMVVFDPKNAQLTKIQIKDNSKAVGIIRARFADITFLPEESYLDKKKAPNESGANGVLQANYSRLARQ